VPDPGYYEELLNSDATRFGGSGMGNPAAIHSATGAFHNLPHNISITLPPLAVVAFRKGNGGTGFSL
jgi:1,4-alpha-glucan branching enzyme